MRRVRGGGAAVGAGDEPGANLVGMAHLTWTGKDAIVNHHQEVPYHTLKADPAVGKEGEDLSRHDKWLPYSVRGAGSAGGAR